MEGDDFYLDVLLYHTKLRCHVVVKMTEFQLKFAGKLNFYLNAEDAQIRYPNDNSSIGIFLCKTPNKLYFIIFLNSNWRFRQIKANS
ncbi:hypothetical protein AHMF7605_21535 [Adhaeribacter arboris]|uniref:YhcG PDDEXK nuclease domain-containing protein n=1 Tax=Adhaeribacter arboris TaxID=2072846 RepID=A0A2T2YK83_9BACT|nr:hypothetical protein AHMF7605_21535 [Adhaeribacter arboris]